MLCFLASGCAAIKEHTGGDVYFDVGVGYQLDERSDWYVRTEREWQCSENWQAHFELGVEWEKTSLGYHHQSWWVCGGPFWDDRKELYQDDIRLTHRFGGRD